MLKLIKFLSLLNIYYCQTYVGCSNLMLVPTRPGVFSSVIIANRVQVSTFLKRLCILHALTNTATRCVGQQWPVCPHRQVKLKLKPMLFEQHQRHASWSSVWSCRPFFLWPFFYFPQSCVKARMSIESSQTANTSFFSFYHACASE